MKLFIKIFGWLVCIIFLVLIALGTAVELKYLPPAETLSANEIPKKYIDTLRKENIIGDNENVYYFYSNGFWSILEDGNLFTDKRVISYEMYEDQFNIYSATYNEIEKVEMNRSDDFWRTSEIEIIKTDGSWFILLVDNDNGRDILFLDELKKLWGKKTLQK